MQFLQKYGISILLQNFHLDLYFFKNQKKYKKKHKKKSKIKYIYIFLKNIKNIKRNNELEHSLKKNKEKKLKVKMGILQKYGISILFQNLETFVILKKYMFFTLNKNNQR
jgi:hypothetical protein